MRFRGVPRDTEHRSLNESCPSSIARPKILGLIAARRNPLLSLLDRFQLLFGESRYSFPRRYRCNRAATKKPSTATSCVGPDCRHPSRFERYARVIKIDGPSAPDNEGANARSRCRHRTRRAPSERTKRQVIVISRRSIVLYLRRDAWQNMRCPRMVSLLIIGPVATRGVSSNPREERSFRSAELRRCPGRVAKILRRRIADVGAQRKGGNFGGRMARVTCRRVA